ncbi:MMPL family transporter [Neobacillus drentensis]|uniref:MMPL family transporter n=1 Tax=Neobacillus drentensis TaxID=220684 RepID=UPI001F305DB1|nr:MMPL family transporter [Neobacillus drentensis]ULT58744.1 MMPL family transporter [Neobacillus drentensis]
MAKYLYRLGQWSVKNRKKIMVGSIGILIAMVILALSMGPTFQDNMSIPGTKSEEAGKLLKTEFQTSGQPARGEVQLIMKAPKGQNMESEQVNKVITKTLDEIKEDKAVASVATPLELGNISQNKKIGFAVVTYDMAADKVTEASKESILEKIEKTRDAGIQTELAGNVAFSEMEIGGVSEGIGVLVAYLVLALTFTSFLAAGTPIFTAVIGLGIGLMTILIGTHFLDITSFSLSLAAMLGLAVGIDYALFIISRFRQQLEKGFSVRESIAIATGTAGSAVVFAGITVIIGLLGLSVAKIPFLTMMGVSAAVCVLIAIIIAVIFVPALLGIIGEKIGPTKKNKLLQRLSRLDKKHARSNKWGEFVTKRPLFVSIVGVALLAVISIPFFHMELGLPDNGTKSKETTERRAYDLFSEAYGPGYHASLVAVAKTSEQTLDAQKAISETTQELSQLSNVKSVTPAIPGSSGKVYMISITPKTGPNDIETKELVNKIRDYSKVMKKEHGIELLVTGSTAVNIDIAQKLNDAIPLFSLLIVGLAFILLVLVFRSILVPLKAVIGFILSLGATLGFVVFVLQDGNLISLFGFPIASPVLCFLPVIVIGILFGLAMDYEMFLVSRMREEFTHTGDARKAVLAGLRDSGGVVTAAGLIMMAVFAGFMLAPDPIIKSMGFALTFGVLFDAFVVRMAIVPAVMMLMGKSAWYLPKWLDKLLPNIDVEGESMMKSLEHMNERKTYINKRVLKIPMKINE